MHRRREVPEDPAGVVKLCTAATPVLLQRLLKAAGEMAFHVLAHSPMRVLNILGSSDS